MQPSRKVRFLIPILAVLATVLIIEAIVVPLGVFIPAEFHDRHVTLFELLQPDPELGFHARPNLHDLPVAWMENSLQAHYNTDRFGFRNAGRDCKEAGIFFVGDSFTWGSWQVREDTFPDLVGQQLGTSIYNLGQESYYVEQYEKVTQRFLALAHPRYLVLCIFANDLTTPITDDDLKNFYERFGWNQYREFPIYKRFFVYQAAQWLDHSAEAMAISVGWRPPPPPSHLDRRVTESGVELYRQLGAHPYYFSQHYNLHTETVVRRLLQYVLNQGVTPLVFLLPSKESAYQHDYLRLFPGDYLNIEETGYRRLCDVAAGLQVSCTDLTPVFRQANHETDTYFKRDPHWNREGHRLAAAEIVKSLRAAHEQ